MADQGGAQRMDRRNPHRPPVTPQPAAGRNHSARPPLLAMKTNDCHPFRLHEAAGLRAAAIRAQDHATAEFFAAVIRSNRAGAPYKPADRLSAAGGKARRTARP